MSRYPLNVPLSAQDRSDRLQLRQLRLLDPLQRVTMFRYEALLVRVLYREPGASRVGAFFTGDVRDGDRDLEGCRRVTAEPGVVDGGQRLGIVVPAGTHAGRPGPHRGPDPRVPLGQLVAPGVELARGGGDVEVSEGPVALAPASVLGQRLARGVAQRADRERRLAVDVADRAVQHQNVVRSQVRAGGVSVRWAGQVVAVPRRKVRVGDTVPAVDQRSRPTLFRLHALVGTPEALHARGDQPVVCLLDLAAFVSGQQVRLQRQLLVGHLGARGDAGHAGRLRFAA